MNGLEDVRCFDCGEHICWMTYSGPTGLHYCDTCAEQQEDEDADED